MHPDRIESPRILLAAVSRPGLAPLCRLARALPRATLLVGARHLDLTAGLANPIESLQGRLSARIPDLMRGFDQLVFFLSVGAVVRLIAPHLRSKYQDPGVLAIDAAGRFVVPVLSGHLGGANAFAARVAGLLGATAVVTTASEVVDTLAVDILGRELGWRVEAPDINLRRAAAAAVDGAPVALVQEAGSRAWWRGPAPLPGNIRVLDSLDALDLDRDRAVLLITRRALPLDLYQRLGERLVVYRPPEDQEDQP